MSEEEFEDNNDEELSFLEQDSLNRLSQPELEIFNVSIEKFIKDPTDSKSLWFLTDNLIEFEDSIIHVKENAYDGFDQLILKSKGLLEDACNLPNVDKTVKALMIETIGLIKQFLAQRTDKGYSKDYGKEVLKPSTYGKYPYYKYKNRIPPKTSLNDEIGKRIAHHLVHKHEPKYEDNETDEELTSMIAEISLVNEGIIPQPEEELYNPKVTEYLLGGLQKLQDRKRDYETKKKELTELSNKKEELTNQKDNLKLFREQLLMKCIDQMIVSAKE